MDAGIVKGFESRKNRDGATDTILLQVEMSDIEDIQTVEMVAHSGLDINPLVGSKVFVSRVGEAWKVATASSDGTVPDIDSGETELYSIDDTGKLARFKLKNDGKAALANSSESLDTLFNDLIDAIVNIITTGSPTTHTVNAASQAALNAIKTRFANLFGSI